MDGEISPALVNETLFGNTRPPVKTLMKRFGFRFSLLVINTYLIAIRDLRTLKEPSEILLYLNKRKAYIIFFIYKYNLEKKY